MHGRIPSLKNAASLAAAQSGHDTPGAMFSGTIVPDADDFAVMVRTLWPVKSAAALTEYCGIPERTARAYARGDREPPMSVLWLLLHSREGFRVLAFIQRHEPPDWFCNYERHRALGADIEKRVKG